uniref:Uncharacterized protein n=1 Tax=Timspurckia oligopyrenoides TaxID=708627 RepID=A0A7S1EUA5_9RHOD|mmetsp:Transcript_7771/g.14108  ORF Transcript_7771/g.14108 Transcript_7771/m.14108 type:complete len:131 (+) Transcript_7771:33-425(+)
MIGFVSGSYGSVLVHRRSEVCNTVCGFARSFCVYKPRGVSHVKSISRVASNRITMQSSPPPNPPINLPSYVLLLSSSFLAIASIGCIFELASGTPQYGTTTTSAILLFSFPSFAFLFYAALQKGKAESEE